MRALIWVVGIAVVAAAFAVLVRQLDGYVLLVWPPFRVELTMSLALVLAVVAFLVFYLALRTVSVTIDLPRGVQAFRARVSREKGERALLDALKLWLEGRHGRALRQAEVALGQHYAPGVAALLGARAAAERGDHDKAREFLARAETLVDEIAVAREMTAVEVALSARDYEGAARALSALSSSGQRHVAALRLAFRTEQALGNWSEVQRVARQLVKHKVISAQQVAGSLRRANLESLRQLRGDPEALARFWKELPDEEQRDARVAESAARLLLEAGDCVNVRGLIEEFLVREWSPALVDVYGRCKGGGVRERIARAEEWLVAHPDDAGLLLTLGRLCLQQQLWGKAQSYFDASLALQPSRDAHVELARLYDQLEQVDAANAHYREAAAQS